MRVLVIGGDGMLGHQLVQGLAPRHETFATLRGAADAYRWHAFLGRHNARFGVDVRDPDAVPRALRDFRPDAVVNAAGVVKQRRDAERAELAIEVNALFPHRLARQCRDAGAFLVQYSTDCVFSGSRGNYGESDAPDPVDLYGRTKLLGEPETDGCLTLRTSMIGPELSRKTGLLEWFLAQRGQVAGYRRAVFSGLTTLEHVRIVDRILQRSTLVSGMFHVSAEPISKYDLLRMVREHFSHEVELVADDQLAIDRSLDSRHFREAFGYRPPAWDEMVKELAKTMRGGAA